MPPKIFPLVRRLLAAGGALLLWPSLVFAQQSSDGFKGHGAALCVAAGEILSQEPGADASIRDAVLAWRQVLHVMDGTDARRQTAIDDARGSLAKNGGQDPVKAARILWPLACATREAQIKYMVVHGSRERTQDNLAEEPGTALSAEAAGRVNVSAACLATAEFFRKPPSSRPLRSAIRKLNPAPPDVATLRTIEESARRAIDETPGSTVGKALVVDYFRYLYTSASSGSDPQPFLSRSSQRLHDKCVEKVAAQ